MNIDVLEKHNDRRMTITFKSQNRYLFLWKTFMYQTTPKRDAFFFSKLHNFLDKKMSEESVIICEDFNCKIENTHNLSSRKLKKILTLLDIFVSTVNTRTPIQANDIPCSRIYFMPPCYVFSTKK